MSNVVTENTINQLGDSLLVHILYYALQPPYRLEPRFVCRRWYRLSKDRTLWWSFFRRDFGTVHSNLWSVREYGGLDSGCIHWENFYLRQFKWTNRPLGMIDLSPKQPVITEFSSLEITQTPSANDCSSNGKNLSPPTPFRLVTIFGSRIITCYEKHPLQVWSLSDGRHLGALEIPDILCKVTTLASSELDNVLAIGDESGNIILYRQPQTPRKRKQPFDTKHNEQDQSIGLEYWLIISSNSSVSLSKLHICRGYLATLSKDGTLSLYKLSSDSSTYLSPMFTTTNSIQSPIAITLRFHATNSSLLLLVAFDIALYDGTHIVTVQEFTFIDGQLQSTRYLDVTASDDERATSSITCLAFGGLSRSLHLVTGHSDHTVHVWSVNHDITHLSTLFGHTGAVHCVAIDDLQPVRVVSGSYDRRVKVWSLPSSSTSKYCHSKSLQTLLMTLDAHNDPIVTLATKQDLRLVSGDITGSWKLWTFDS